VYQSFSSRDQSYAVVKARKSTAMHLAKFDPALVLPVLKKDLMSNDEEYVMNVLRVLGAIGERARETLGDILKTCESAELGLTRRLAAEALAACGGNSQEAWHKVSAMARSDERPQVRAACIRLLARFEVPTREMVNVLTAGLGDRDERVRCAAAHALSLVAPEEMAPVVAALGAASPATRAAAARAIGLAANPPAEGRRAIVAALDDKDPTVRAAATQSLAWLGGNEAANAKDTLLKLLKDDDPWLRAAAAGALRHGKEDAYRALLAALSDRDYKVRREARASLVHLGGVALDVVTELLESESPKLRWQAAEILKLMGDGASAATPKLLARLDDDTWYVRREAVRALGAVASKDQAVIRRFRVCVEKDPEWTVRKEAFDWLANWDASADLEVEPY
jgi:HEAT repeat protein